MRIDSLFFNQDGTIKKVIPTLRGVGVTDASRKIQINRYSLKSSEGASIAFLDTIDMFGGWKAGWMLQMHGCRYNGVDFGGNRFKSVQLKVASTTGGLIDIRLDKVDGPLVAQIDIGKTTGWKVIHSKLVKNPFGMHNLIIVLNGKSKVEIDWLSFK